MAEAIKELLDARKIGYVCVSNARLRKSDKEAARNTKAYEELAADLYDPENIQIDLLTGSFSKRTALDNIIETFKQGANKNFSPKGAIVIHDLSALGTTAETVVENYERIAREDIGVVIYSDEQSRYSTVEDEMICYLGDFGEIPTEEMLPQAYQTLFNDIRALTIETKQGRKKKERVFTPAWKEIYWLYENYAIREPLVYKNRLIGSTTKVTFKRWCDDYEKSEEYAKDEEEQAKKNQLEAKPKRYGKVPEGYSHLASLMEIGKLTFEEARKEAGLPNMTETTYKRYLLKVDKDDNGKLNYDGDGEVLPSRKEMAKASNMYYNEQISKEIAPQE